MSTYTTRQGDMWDEIAFRVYGSTAHTGKLVKANLNYAETYIFPAGIVLNIVELTNDDAGRRSDSQPEGIRTVEYQIYHRAMQA